MFEIGRKKNTSDKRLKLDHEATLMKDVKNIIRIHYFSKIMWIEIHVTMNLLKIERASTYVSTKLFHCSAPETPKMKANETKHFYIGYVHVISHYKTTSCQIFLDVN